MPSIGFSELIVILMILLLVFGASRLPQLGESLGRTIRSLKRGMNGDEKIEIGKDTQQQSAPLDKNAAIADAELIDKDPKR